MALIPKIMVYPDTFYFIGKIKRQHGLNWILTSIVENIYLYEIKDFIFIKIDGLFVPFFLKRCFFFLKKVY